MSKSIYPDHYEVQHLYEPQGWKSFKSPRRKPFGSDSPARYGTLEDARCYVANYTGNLDTRIIRVRCGDEVIEHYPGRGSKEIEARGKALERLNLALSETALILDLESSDMKRRFAERTQGIYDNINDAIREIRHGWRVEDGEDKERA